MFEPGAFFEVADRELDNGVSTMELVDIDSGAVEIGEEPEVAPVGPQPPLLVVGQTGASNDIVQRFRIETIGQRRGQQQTGVGDQIRIIEKHFDAVDGMRYSAR